MDTNPDRVRIALDVVIFDRFAKSSRAMYMQLSRNLGGSDTKIVNLTQKHIRGRLAEALIVLRDHYGFEDHLRH